MVCQGKMPIGLVGDGPINASNSLFKDIAPDTCIPTQNLIKTVLLCKPGFGAAGGGFSFVDVQQKAAQVFRANMTEKIPFPGGVRMGLRPADNSSVVNLNVTVDAVPISANVTPSKGINTYWKFEVEPGTKFSADLTWAYNETDLAHFNYTAHSLKWAVYNPVTGTWDAKGATIVNTTDRTVIYTTSGFSEWTIVSQSDSGAFALLPSVTLISAALMLSMAVFGGF
jgi:hypothetical protein